MQGDQGRHAALFQSTQHGPVAFQRVFIPAVGFGLDAAPFHRKAMRVLPILSGAVKVLAPASTAPPIAGQARFAIGVAVLFPFPPLVVGVVTLYLMRGGGRAP